MNILDSKNMALLTDLYQLTMAYGYWKQGNYNKQAVFHLFYRKNPFGGKYCVASGLKSVTNFINELKFESDDIQYLASLQGSDRKPLFDTSFLDLLKQFKFSGNVYGIPEGTVVFPHQPLLRIEGPLWQCQFIETALLTLVNFSTLIATKASRIVAEAKGDTVLEFGLRRAQGADGGLSASRAAYIGGCDATSNVLAGKLFGIPVKGTHAHSWVMCFDEEIEAFRAYAKAMPNNCTLLVDTYDTIKGVEKAIIVGKELRQQGHDLAGIRLDSGDLAALSIEARSMLDAAGFKDTKIVASNSLDEYTIKTLKEKGAKIDVWGVGTKLSTAYDQPALGGVYKLGAIKNKEGNWSYKLKLSENKIKISNPGILQVKRFYKIENNKKIPICDKIYDLATGIVENIADSSENLLVPIFKDGIFVYQEPTIHQSRQLALDQLGMFAAVFDKEGEYEVTLEEKLAEKKEQLIAQKSLKPIV